MDVIKFYRRGDDFGEFSNFSYHRVYLKGKYWPTTEHYFQAQKFAGTEHEEAVRMQKGPGFAAQMGRNRKLPLRKDWESIKDNVMRDAVYAKFTQHKDLKELLLSTGEAVLIEHTTNDSYWGDGGDGSGKNMLGRILMEIRKRIRNEAQAED
ncbi:MAG: NADAR family protein [Myxococcales bacterium]|nr:NADAR family protein [Myxococcales bacterium]